MLIKKYLKITWFYLSKTLKYLILVLILGLILSLGIFVSSYQNIKTTINQGLSAKTHLLMLDSKIKAKDWTEALNQATQAQANFSTALDSLKKIRENSAINKIKLFSSQINNLQYLLTAGKILTNSIQDNLSLIQKLDKIIYRKNSYSFNNLSSKDKSNLLILISKSEPKIQKLKTNLNLVILNLNKIKKFSVLYPVYGQISDLNQKLEQISTIIDKLPPVLKLLPALSGKQNTSRFLLILQNNDELRPSGGFIGVYGILEIKDGTIISLKTNDSYHLDMPASLSKQWNLQPPSQLKKYLKVKKWYLRDANWSPDWSQSAQKIIQIYNGENLAINKKPLPFTGVIAINPDFVSDLIKLVGPLTVQGTTYTAKNFQDLLQYNVEIAYKNKDISSWDRKNIINNLMDKLKNNLFNLPASAGNKLASILNSNINKKNIQIYFSNPQDENLIQSLGASGKIPITNGDFMMVVDANLAAFKSDAVVKKDISYQLQSDKNKVFAEVTLNYHHQGKFNWRTTTYRSYTRIYAPLSSKLISLQSKDLSTADVNIINNSILDKTVFGFFFTIKPGSSRKIILKYQLPDSIYKQLENKNYQLLVGKQSGQRVNNLSIDLNFNQQHRKWSTDLTTNRIFEF